MKPDIPWRDLYAAAMLELDHAILGRRIQEAQQAIQQAVEEQLACRDNRAAEELQALTDATHNLQTLQRVELSIVIPAGNPVRLRTKQATS
jgi:hypothetical protein